MNILSEAEWERLEKVKTTEDQAIQIKMRNMLLLESLQRVPVDSVEEFNVWVQKNKYGTYARSVALHESTIGCPHCIECDKCAWREEGDEEMEPCLSVKFGGSSYNELPNYPIRLEYYSNDEYLTLCCVDEFDFDDLALFRSHKEQIERFLLGHIEWINRLYPELNVEIH